MDIQKNGSIFRIPTTRFTKLADFLAKPLVIALLLTFVVDLFMPRQARFKLETERFSLRLFINEIRMYDDLNGDGESELIRSFTTTAGNHAISIESVEERIYNQWNFPGEIPNANIRFFTGDFNRNGLKEVFAFSQTNDSVWLHFVEPLGPNSHEIRDVFIDRIAYKDGRTDFYIASPQLVDLEGDGNLQVLFSLRAGYSLQPRRVYLYDIQNDTLIYSESTGIAYLRLIADDVDGDDKQEILISNFATGNLRQHMPIPYKDSSAWFAIMNSKLDFTFEPIAYEGFTKYVYSAPFVSQGEKNVLVYSTNAGFLDSLNSLALYNAAGTMLAEKPLNNNMGLEMYYGPLGNKQEPLVLFVDFKGHIYRVSEDLELQKIHKGNSVSGFFYPALRPDFYAEFGFKLLPVFNSQGVAFLFGEKLQHFLQSDIKTNTSILETLSVFKLHDGTKKLFLFGRDESYFFEILSNSLFYTQWFYLLLIFSGIYALFYMSRYIYKKQLLRNQAAEKELLELQFQSVSNQINPHFIFNALNAITSAIYLEKKEDAFKMGARFSGLMRETLSGSEKISRPLENEIDFVRNYLELERFRFKNSFNFQIEIEEDVDLQSHVPKMIVQTFAENAVKHGLQPLKAGGKLHIHIRQHKGLLHIRLEDNGVGRRQHAPTDSTYSTGNGLKIVEKIIQLYTRLNKGEIRYSIIDLAEDGEAKGTRVEVWVNRGQA
jgi:hypothetical protein